MSTATLESVQEDQLAMSLAQALMVANRAAIAEGMVPADSFILIDNEPKDGANVWCISYAPRDYIRRRGGDLTVCVDQQTGGIREIVHGQ